MQIAKGTVGRIKGNGPLEGAVVQVVRQSKQTSGLTVKMLGKVGAYDVGSQVNISPSEFEATIEPKRANLLFYAHGPNCWGKGFTMLEAFDNAALNWPRGTLDPRTKKPVPKPQIKHMSLYLIKSPTPIAFSDVKVSDFDGSFRYPEACDVTQINKSVLALD